MFWLSENPMWEAFGSRALFYATYGGADFGECREAVRRVGDDGTDAWLREWSALAARLDTAAAHSAKGGHTVSAREAWLRATTYYRVAYAPLFGTPVDPRLSAAFENETRCFARAAALFDPPVECVEIPYEGAHTLPGLFVRAAEDGKPRPTVVHVDGYDGNIYELFAAHAAAAVARGYNILLVDGPGQGRNLIRDGLHLRPDWENVVHPILDFALALPGVDPRRVVLAGWSYGGFLAARAACFEQRIAALWVDPGQFDQRNLIAPALPLSDDEKARFPDIDRAPIDQLEQRLRAPGADAMLNWRLIRRGLWVHGVPSLFDYFADMLRYELSPFAHRITCPTLVAAADGDPGSVQAQVLFDAIGSERKSLMRFTAEEGAAGHCEGAARRWFHQRCYDWLDEQLAP